MNYENFCTRHNPGLLIFIVDQNEYMDEKSSSGLTLADRAADLINRYIAELGLHLTMGNEIRRECKVCIIGYGGRLNEAHLIHFNYIDNLLGKDSIPIKIVKEKIGDGCGSIIEIEVMYKQFVLPESRGLVCADDAFCMAKDIISRYIVFSNYKEYQPAPIITHITSDKCMMNSNRMESCVNFIQDLILPDGSPIISNCILTTDETETSLYPSQFKEDSKGLGQLYKLCSILPNTFLQALSYLHCCSLFDFNESEYYAFYMNPHWQEFSSGVAMCQFGGSEPYFHRLAMCHPAR